MSGAKEEFPLIDLISDEEDSPPKSLDLRLSVSALIEKHAQEMSRQNAENIKKSKIILFEANFACFKSDFVKFVSFLTFSL